MTIFRAGARNPSSGKVQYSPASEEEGDVMFYAHKAKAKYPHLELFLEYSPDPGENQEPVWYKYGR